MRLNNPLRRAVLVNALLLGLNAFWMVEHIAEIGWPAVLVAMSAAGTVLSALALCFGCHVLKQKAKLALAMAIYQKEECPECQNTLFYEGPRGHFSVNVMCARCRTKFCLSPPDVTVLRRESDEDYQRGSARTVRECFEGSGTVQAGD